MFEDQIDMDLNGRTEEEFIEDFKANYEEWTKNNRLQPQQGDPENAVSRFITDEGFEFT